MWQDAPERGLLIVRQIRKVIKQFIPDLFERMDKFVDGRKRKDYQVSELVMGGIALFIFKEGTRNNFNYERKETKFRENYFKIFNKRLPHMDTVNAFLKGLADKELEQLKTALVKGLIDQRALHCSKLLGKCFTVAVDATGAGSYDENDAEKTRVSKTSKNGVTTYAHYVLEAKLVTPSGMAISLASEWVANEEDRDYDKQDCEHKAFGRLAVKLKKDFPRLPICLLADGLYPNKTFMNICRDNEWDYIVVLKDKSLKTVQEDIVDSEDKHRHHLEIGIRAAKGKKHIQRDYKWISQPLEYEKNKLYWFNCTETITEYDKDYKAKVTEDEPTRFVFLTNLAVDIDNVARLTCAGRRRWKIENGGFNAQKNHGYNLGHKFSRTSFTAYKNFYQCMQIAHAINQLVELSSTVAAFFADPKLSVKFVWGKLVEWLCWEIVDIAKIEINERFQVRFAG